MIKFSCEHCGEVDRAKVNGYYVGDRLLEGVWFEVLKNDDGSYTCNPLPEHQDYFRQLAKGNWLEQISQFCQDYDNFSCIDCDSSCIPMDELEHWKQTDGLEGCPHGLNELFFDHLVMRYKCNKCTWSREKKKVENE